MPRWRVLVVMAAALLPGVVLLPAWRLAGLGAGEDDVLYYLPSRVFFGDCVRADQAPWLNPWTGLDRSFVADPQSAVFYPFTWLFAVGDALTVYPLSLWLHYGIALLGAYRLLRSGRLHPFAALFGATAFALGGFMVAHRAHFAIQNAAAWTPWVLWRVSRYAQRGGFTRLAAAAGFAALQVMAGHVQIAALTALGSLVYVAAGSEAGGRRAALIRWGVAWVCAGGLCAIQAAPTLAYLTVCTRGERGFVDFVENSWNPLSAVNFVAPMFLGQRTPNPFDQPYWGPSHQVEQFAYPGIAVLLLALVALRTGWRGDGWRRGWGALLIAAGLLALGQFAPLAYALYLFPGANLFRVPARALVLVDLALTALAATALHDLIARATPYRARMRLILLDWTERPARWLASALGLVIACGVGAALVGGAGAWSKLLVALRPWNPAVLAPAALILLTGYSLRFALRDRRRPLRFALVAGVLLVDLALIGWTLDVPAGARTPADLLDSPERRAWLPAVRSGGGRLWTVTTRAAHDAPPGEYIDPIGKGVANTNVLVGVPSATDYGPLQPRLFSNVFPLMPWGEARGRAPQALLDRPEWRAAFDVRWLLLCDPNLKPPPGCDRVAVSPAGYSLYRNPDAVGMAFIDDAKRPAVVRYEELSPTRFRTHVVAWPPALSPPRREQNATLVVSRLALPGWAARYADGRPVPLSVAHGALLAAEVPVGGAFAIEWAYSPPGLGIGAVISALTLLSLATAVVHEWLTRSRQRIGTRSASERPGE